MGSMENLKKDKLYLPFTYVVTQSCLSFSCYLCPLPSFLHPQPNLEVKGKKLGVVRRGPSKLPQTIFLSVPGGASGLLKFMERKGQTCL